LSQFLWIRGWISSRIYASLGLTALFFAASVLIEAIGLTVKTISMTFTSGSQSA
jgi:hypothetical protein